MLTGVMTGDPGDRIVAPLFRYPRPCCVGNSLLDLWGQKAGDKRPLSTHSSATLLHSLLLLAHTESGFERKMFLHMV